MSTSPSLAPPDATNRVAAFADPAFFTREQQALAHTWTFLGLASSLTRDGDWFRTTLAAREVFVQRFGDALRGFENLCAHRFNPLRNTDSGNGPIVCGFHHWRYDQEGRAIGIPNCQEVFGASPRELDVRLNKVEIATCGQFIFGRFAGGRQGPTLENWLGETFPIIESMSLARESPQFIRQSVNANWKFSIEASLDDYHLIAVHPDTFGKIGYLKRELIFYHRFGPHSAYFTNSDPAALTQMARECREGTWVSANYRTFNFFPNYAVAHFQAHAQFWYILVMQCQPLAADRSLQRAWIYPAPFAARHTRFDAATARWSEPVRRRFVRHYSRKVMMEDNRVCERLQENAGRGDGQPFLGKLEERVGWFGEAWRQAMREA